MKPAVSKVRFTPAPQHQVRSGLVGFVSFLIEGRVRVDGVVLRKTAEGCPVLTFPARRDEQGRDHPYVRPIDDETRRAMEAQVLAQLGIEPKPKGGR